MTDKTKSAMIALCSLHVLQGVYDDTRGTDLFTQKRKSLTNNLLKEFDPYFEKILKADPDLSESQIQFNNLANLIECLGQWLSDGNLEEKMEQLAVLTGHEFQLNY